MKKVCVVFFSIPVVFMLAACDKTPAGPAETDIFGTWVQQDYLRNGVTLMKRAAELAHDEPGFVISPNGEFLQRKNSGWCGTPPITYANFDGEWMSLSSDVLKINVGYWGGTTNYKMEIVSANQSELRFKYIHED